MNHAECLVAGSCFKDNTVSYKLCGGRNLFEDRNQSGVMLVRLKVGEVLNLTLDF